MASSTELTLVAHGALAPIALKVARTPDPHAVGLQLARLVLVEPLLAPATINGLLTTGGKAPVCAAASVTVDAFYADESTRDRRAPMLRAVFGPGLDVVAPDDGGDAVAAAFLAEPAARDTITTIESGDATEISTDDSADSDDAGLEEGDSADDIAGGGGCSRAALQEPDERGCTLWCAELTVDLNKITKQPEQVRHRHGL